MRAAVVFALIALSAFAAANLNDAEADAEFEVAAEQDVDADAAQQSGRALALTAHAEFLRVSALAQAYARLSVEERQIARIVAEEYNGDVGRLRIGQLTRKQQSELIPLGMSYNRDLNVRLAEAARVLSGADARRSRSSRVRLTQRWTTRPV